MTVGYTADVVLAQIAIKLPADLLERIDAVVAAGSFENRSAAVRAGLHLILERTRSETIDEAFARGFGRHPESASEIEEAVRLGTEAIDAEPWEPWW